MESDFESQIEDMDMIDELDEQEIQEVTGGMAGNSEVLRHWAWPVGCQFYRGGQR